MSKLKLLSLLSAMIYIGCLSTGIATSAAPAAKPESSAQSEKPHWLVVVLDRVSYKEPADLDEGGRTKWKTFLSDGVHSTRWDDPIVSSGTQLVRLKTRTVRAEASCPQDKLHYSYEIDLLMSQPLSSGGARVLLGQQDLASSKLTMQMLKKRCKQRFLGFSNASAAGEADRPSYHQCQVDLVSIYRDYLGLKLTYNSDFIDTPHPNHTVSWNSYLLRSDSLRPITRKQLPQRVLTQAANDFAKENPDYVDGIDLDCFLVKPSHGGASVEFGTPNLIGSGGGVYSVAIRSPTGLSDRYDLDRLRFVREHPTLIAWSKSDFYTIAPDKSAVVFSQGKKLYWQKVSGKAQLIGTVKNIGGWQWCDANHLSETERRLLHLN